MYSIKVTHNGEVRRTQVALDGTVTTAYEQLIQTVRNMFPDLYLNKSFCLTWQDDEGDTVTVSSEMELSEAVRVMSTMYGGAALRFAVKKVDAPAAPATAAKPAGPTGAFVAGMDQQAAAAASAKEEAAVHYGVTCDECGAHPIVGVRYHCTVRHNFDLCSACFNKKAQPYSMIKLEEPMGRHGRRLGDRCARKAAKMAAKEAAANAAAAEGGVPQGHPWAHHLHGRHRGMHGHHGHGPHGGRGGRFHWFGPAGEGIPYESCEDYYGPAAEGEEQQQQEKEGSETSPAAADANKKVPAAATAAAAAAAGFVPPPFPPPGMHGPGPHFGTVGPPGYGAAGPLPHLGPGCPPPPFGGPHPHGGPHPFGGPHGHPFGPHAGPHHGPHHGPPGGGGGRGGPIHGGMFGGRGPFGGRGGHGPHGGRGPFGGPWGVPPPAGSTPLASAVPIPVDASSTSDKATKGTTAAPAPAVEKKLRCEEVSTHYGVTCDACGRCPIVGARYKCTVREDFDLCATCFGADLQSYPMVLFAYPGDIGTLVEPIIPPIVRDLNDEDAGLQAAIGESLCRSQVSDVTASVDEHAEEEEPNTTTTTTDAAADLSYTFVDLGLASSPSPVTPKSAPAALPAPPALSAAEAARIAAEEAALARAEAERAALLAAWAKELGLLADMGFSDFDAVLPLLQEHVGTPASQGGDQGSRAAKAVEGMQTVVATLLLGQSGIRR